MALGGSDRYEFIISARDDFTRQTEKAKASVTGISSEIKKFAVVAAAGFGIAKLVQFSDEITSMKNKLRTVADENQIPKLTQDMIDLSNRARIGADATTTLFTRLQRGIEQYGGTLEQSAVITEAVAKSLSLSGANAGEAEAAMVQLSQAFNKGKLDGDEFRTVMELMPDAMQAIANEMGVTRGELLKLAPEGKITAQVMANAFIASADKINERFGKSVPTISQSLVVLRNRLMSIWGQVNQEIPITSSIAKLILGFGRLLEVVGKVTIGSVRLLKQFGSVIKDFGMTAVKNFMAAGKDIVANWEWVGNSLEWVFKFIAKAGQIAPKILATVWNGFVNNLGRAIIYVIDQIINLAELSNNIPGITIDTDGLYNARKSVANFAETMNVTQEDVEGAFAAIGRGIKEAAGFVKSSFTDMGKNADITVPSLEKVGTSAEDTGKKAKKAKEDVENSMMKFIELRSKINDLNGEYSNMAKEAGQALAELKKDHEEKVKGMTDSLTKLKQSLADIRADLAKGLEANKSDYDRRQGDLTASQAEEAVKQEQKIADMRAEYDEKRKKGLEDIAKLTKDQKTKEADEARVALGKELDELQAKLDKEQAAYDEFTKNVVFNNGELSKAREDAAKTDFERSIEAIGKQKIEEASAYEERRVQMKTEAEQKIADIQAEMEALQTQLTEEQRIFAAKRDEYAKTEATFTRFKNRFLEGLTAMSAGAEGKIIAIQNRFESLRQLIAEVGQFDPDDQGYSFGGVSSAAATRGSTTNNTTNAAVNLNISINGADDPRTTAQKVEEAVARALQKARLASQ